MAYMKTIRGCTKICVHPLVSCGGSTRTNDLQVMSLASYQLLHSAIFSRLRVQRYEVFATLQNFLQEIYYGVPILTIVRGFEGCLHHK